MVQGIINLCNKFLLGPDGNSASQSAVSFGLTMVVAANVVTSQPV